MPNFFRSIIRFFKRFFPKKIGYPELLSQGAQIIDVRTPIEFSKGAIKDSLNIPLDDLRSQISKIEKDRPVITCCATGLRSGFAKKILIRHGFEQVVNGGSWSSLKRKIK